MGAARWPVLGLLLFPVEETVALTPALYSPSRGHAEGSWGLPAGDTEPRRLHGGTGCGLGTPGDTAVSAQRLWPPPSGAVAGRRVLTTGDNSSNKLSSASARSARGPAPCRPVVPRGSSPRGPRGSYLPSEVRVQAGGGGPGCGRHWSRCWPTARCPRTLCQVNVRVWGGCCLGAATEPSPPALGGGTHCQPGAPAPSSLCPHPRGPSLAQLTELDSHEAVAARSSAGEPGPEGRGNSRGSEDCGAL